MFWLQHTKYKFERFLILCKNNLKMFKIIELDFISTEELKFNFNKFRIDY